MPAYKENIKIRLSNDGDVPHTLLHIARISNDYSPQVLEESAKLEAKTDLQTAKNIWHFVRENVEYEEDSQNGELEVLRRPARTLFDKKGDCDCATILISAILKNLDIPHYYKVVAYENVGAWQHIYPVMIDRQTGKHIAIDFVPEVPSPLFELPYVDATAFDSETGTENPQFMKMNTDELGCATRQAPIIYDILPPPPQIDFDGETTGQCQAVEHTKILTALEHIKNLTDVVPSDFPNAPFAQAENQIVRAILESPEVPDLKESFKNAIADKSDFAPIYAAALKSLEQTEYNPTAEVSIKQSLNGTTLGAFPYGEALNFAGTIAGSYFSMQALDKQNAQSEYNLGLQLQNTTAQIEGQQKLLAAQAQEAEKQRQFELQKLAQLATISQNQPQQKAPTASPEPPKDPPPTTKKWYEQQWVMYAGGGLVLLILGLVFYFFTKKKKGVLNGTGKKRRKSTQRKRRTSLAGATKTHTRKRTTSPKMPKMKMPKSKPRTKTRAKARTKAKTGTRKKNSQKTRRAKK